MAPESKFSRRRRKVLALAPAVVASPIASSAHANADDSGQLARWLRTSAQPIHEYSSAAARLAERLVDVRVVGIGEGTHGTHEDFAFKAALIVELARTGTIDTVAFEASRRAGVALNDFVAAKSADSAAAAMRKGLYSIWHCKEVEQLLVSLRTLAQSRQRPIQIVGLDVQAAANDTSFALSSAAKLGLLDLELERDLAGLSSASHPGKAVAAMQSEEHARVRRALKGLALALSAQRDFNADAEGGFLAAVAAEHGFELLLTSHADTVADASASMIAVRDRGMAAIALEVARKGSVAIWAHNGHVDRQTPMALGALPMGYHLDKSLGPAYAVVKFAWADGSIHAIDMRAAMGASATSRPSFRVFRAPNNRPGSIGRILLDAGLGDTWIDLRALPNVGWAQEFLARSVTWSSIGYAFDERAWELAGSHPSHPVGRGTDVVVFFPVISPSHRFEAL